MSERDCTSITWTIHNYSYNWHKIDEAIVSPMFRIYMPEETKWKLMFFPNGVTSFPNSVGFFLYRNENCNGAENIEVKYSLAIQKSDGSYINIPTINNKFRKNVRKGYPNFLHKTNESTYIQQDNLTIRCKLIRFNGKAVGRNEIFVRTIIEVETQFFQWPIQNFSNLAPDQRQSFLIKSKSKHAIILISVDVNSNNRENISFCIDVFDQSIKFCSVKTFIIDSTKQEIDSGEYDYVCNCGNSVMFPLKLTKNKLMENKNLYLPNNVLTLCFELKIYTIYDFEGKEESTNESIPHPFLNEVTEDYRKCIDHKKLTDCSCVLIADLTSLHKDESTCDMKLQTKTDTFPVHILILSARSSVFKAMFSNDMKEKINGSVDISDLSDETVRRFLLYLYTDQLEDLKWDDALQLYKAADKYAVTSLRYKCSSFLKENLNVENSCEALILADLHQDKDLKETTQKFILKNAKVIFKSEEWKILADDNSKLALETALRHWNED